MPLRILITAQQAVLDTPPERTTRIPNESRATVVPGESHTTVVPVESRRTEVT